MLPNAATAETSLLDSASSPSPSERAPRPGVGAPTKRSAPRFIAWPSHGCGPREDSRSIAPVCSRTNVSSSQGR